MSAPGPPMLHGEGMIRSTPDLNTRIDLYPSRTTTRVKRAAERLSFALAGSIAW